MIIARAKSDIVFAAINCYSPKGARLRKDRKARTGDIFEVTRFFKATGPFTHGAKCVTVRDNQGNMLSTFADLFEYIELDSK